LPPPASEHLQAICDRCNQRIQSLDTSDKFTLNEVQRILKLIINALEEEENLDLYFKHPISVDQIMDSENTSTVQSELSLASNFHFDLVQWQEFVNDLLSPLLRLGIQREVVDRYLRTPTSMSSQIIAALRMFHIEEKRTSEISQLISAHQSFVYKWIKRVDRSIQTYAHEKLLEVLATEGEQEIETQQAISEYLNSDSYMFYYRNKIKEILSQFSDSSDMFS
jgi:hypothetical protein